MCSHRLLVLLLHSLLHMANAHIKNCYKWGGDYSRDFPCDPEANVSACCAAGWICRTNLFCDSAPQNPLDPRHKSVPGTCTDRNWADSKNPACPFVMNFNMTTKGYKDFDYKLNTTICDDGTVCPRNNFAASNDTCCDQHQGITEINYHNEAVIPSVAAHMSDYYSSAGYTIPTDGVYRAPYSTASTATNPSVPAAAAASTTPASLPTSSGAPPPSPGLSSGAKAGIGIGVALGVFLLVGLAAFFWMRRRKPKNETDAQPNHQKMSPSADGSVMYGFPQDLPAPPPRMEVDADPHHLLQRHEMHAHERGVVELPEHERRARELPG